MVNVGHLQINLKLVDGISESQFLEQFEAHYWYFADSEKQMKLDYKELRKLFTKKEKGAN